MNTQLILSERTGVSACALPVVQIVETGIFTVKYGQKPIDMLQKANCLLTDFQAKREFFGMDGEGTVALEYALFAFDIPVKTNVAALAILAADTIRPWRAGGLEHLLCWCSEHDVLSFAGQVIVAALQNKEEPVVGREDPMVFADDDESFGPEEEEIVQHDDIPEMEWELCFRNPFSRYQDMLWLADTRFIVVRDIQC